MSPGVVPGSGEDGEQPSRPPVPGNGHDADLEWDGAAEVARLVADIDAGREQVPDESDGLPGTWFSLAGTSDPAEVDLAGFAQGGPLNTRPPDAVLAALAEMAADPAVLQALTDNQVLGLAAAGRRLAARGAWVQQAAVAEFAGRRAEPDPRKATGYGFTPFAADELVPELVLSTGAAEEAMARARDAARRLPACTALLRDGLISAFQLQIITDATAFLDGAGAAEADTLLAAAAAGLTPSQLRVMCTRTVMMIDPAAAQRRKDSAARHARITRFQEDSGNAALCGRDLPPADVLASSAHIDGCARALRAGGVAGTLEQLRVLVFLDLTRGRDPLTRLTGTADPAGRDARDGDPAGTDPDTASPAGQDGDAGSGGAAHGRDERDQRGQDDPWDQDDRWDADDRWDEDDADDGGTGNADTDDGDAGNSGTDNGEADEDGGDADGGPGNGPTPGGPGGPGRPAGSPPASPVAPVKATITLLVPLGTLLGWSSAPGEIPGFGLLDPQTTRDITTAAAAHPQTRWCVTAVAPDGTAAAHGCAPGPHPWIPAHYANSTGPHPPPGHGPNGPGPPRGRPPPPPPGTARPPGATRTAGTAGTPAAPGPADQAAHVTALLRRLRVRLSPIAKGTCDHRHYSDRYVISRKVKDLIKARATTCTAPGCNRPAAQADADHTIAWPAGPSCECNIGAPCRYHHRNKQAPGWRLEQPEPGVMTWHTPSGRSHTTYPTKYMI